ncbi:MAG: PQQ-dependent sugar dehydrogenase [Desulfobacteraceae bacterium]
MKVNYGNRFKWATSGGLVGLLFSCICCAADPPRGPIDTIGKTPLETGWKAITITGGLMRPWSAAWLPDGKTLLVTEREGRLRVVRDGELQMDSVKGVPDVLPLDQGGLLDIALHPDFTKNRRVYLTYSAGQRQANRTTLAQGRINEELTELTEVKKLFQVAQAKPGGQHFGSRLLWLDDGTLLMSIGDGGNPPLQIDGRLIRLNAQDLSSHLGKILRLNEDGKPPADNPFADDGDPKTDPLIWTYGHRNIQGLALHPQSRTVWATEHGARGGDELNMIRKGQNYGWPKATYSVEYFGPRISESTRLEGAIDPAVVWTPCIAPSGLVFYTGPEFPSWQGDLLAGGLVLRQIRRIDFEDGKIVGQTTLQFEDRIRWVGQGPDGGIYVLTDEIDGKLLRIVPQE